MYSRSFYTVYSITKLGDMRIQYNLPIWGIYSFYNGIKGPFRYQLTWSWYNNKI